MELFGFIVSTVLLLGNVALYTESLSICDRVPIHTTSSKEKGDGGFSIQIKGLPVDGRYLPGETYSGRSCCLVMHTYMCNGNIHITAKTYCHK